MLHRYSEVFRSLLVAADLTVVAAVWLAAYWIRFEGGFEAPFGTPDLQVYLLPLVAIVPLWFVLLRSHDLYEPWRTGSLLREAGAILRANAIGVVALTAITFFFRSYSYSRGVVLGFAIACPVALIGLRGSLRLGLRSLRRRGYNLRYVLVVGGGRLAEEIIERIHAHPEAGLRANGVLAESSLGLGRAVRSVPVLGDYTALKDTIRRLQIDQVIIALPRVDADRLEKVLADLEDEIVSVKLVPDLLDVATLRGSIEDLDGMPIINLRDSPMVGWAGVQKRAFDLLVSTLALVVTGPLLAAVAVAIRATGGGPVFYHQQRMGLDGRVFRMIKFRTMAVDAEDETGPVWSRSGDQRRTGLGAWLRRFSIDELPQLWNVLRGDMSLVGPRPERPVFIEEFRREVPGYMLRHKVKAGLTGWAQVHGWRGRTSLHERVEHDIYYIQNWSFGLDMRILLRTLWRVLIDRNAY